MTIFLSPLLLPLIATIASNFWRKNCFCKKRIQFLSICLRFCQPCFEKTVSKFEHPNLQIYSFSEVSCFLINLIWAGKMITDCQFTGFCFVFSFLVKIVHVELLWAYCPNVNTVLITCRARSAGNFIGNQAKEKEKSHRFLKEAKKKAFKM